MKKFLKTILFLISSILLFSVILLILVQITLMNSSIMIIVSILLFLFLFFALFRKKHLFKIIYWSFGILIIFIFFLVITPNETDLETKPIEQFVESNTETAIEMKEPLPQLEQKIVPQQTNEIQDVPLTTVEKHEPEREIIDVKSAMKDYEDKMDELDREIKADKKEATIETFKPLPPQEIPTPAKLNIPTQNNTELKPLKTNNRSKLDGSECASSAAEHLPWCNPN